MKKQIVFVLVLLTGVAVMAANPKKGRDNMENRDGMRSERYEEVKALKAKVYEQHKGLLDANREKIQKLRLEQEKVHLALKEELMKEKPDWNKVSKWMDEQKAARDGIWKIQKEQQLTIMKSLTHEERAKWGSYSRMRDSDGYKGRPAKGK
jgi:hypothetical protein